MINIYICSHDDYYNSFTPLLGTIGFPLLQHLRSRGLQGAGCCLWSCLSFNVLLHSSKRKKKNPEKTTCSCSAVVWACLSSGLLAVDFIWSSCVSQFVCIQLAIKPFLPLCFTLAAIKLCSDCLKRTSVSVAIAAMRSTSAFFSAWTGRLDHHRNLPQCRPPQRNKALIRVINHQCPYFQRGGWNWREWAP